MSERKRIATTYRLDTLITDNLVDLANDAGESVNAYVERILYEHCNAKLPLEKQFEPLGDQRRRASKRGLKVVKSKDGNGNLLGQGDD
ncbi:MAG: hypothetical protein KME64_03905 [Scytonematopsis contorta HA4267-MV1]|jgi:hypothetical protein|nr:hypothetical protein [Scytonematopsis contorta HA4267-MV1]